MRWWLALAVICASTTAHAFSGGITSDHWGYTGANACNNCHAGGAVVPTVVSFASSSGTLTGKTGTLVGTGGVSAVYVLTVNIGTAALGGITVTPTGGTLALCSSSPFCGGLRSTATSNGGAALTSPYSPQIVQATPRAKDASNHVTFSFSYTPPADACSAQLLIGVLAADGAANVAGDKGDAFTYTITSSGTACSDDGNPCTVDACNAGGTCAHTPTTCGPSDPGHDAGMPDVQGDSPSNDGGAGDSPSNDGGAGGCSSTPGPSTALVIAVVALVVRRRRHLNRK